MTPAALVEAARAAFSRARRAGGRDVDGVLAGRPVRLSFGGDFFAGQLLRALAIEQRPASGATGAQPVPALRLHAWDLASTGVRLTTDSWAAATLGPSGIVEGLSDDRYQVSMDVHGALASLLDRKTGEAYHYVPDPARLPSWETTHPARMLLAGWARAQGLMT
ncbi:MAG TPA: hypothetical protein VH741_03070, partial [Candidatus Limnocylindrales bacterium]